MARICSVDPLEKFRFAVSWSADGDSEGTALARMGFKDMQMPKRTTNKGTYREGIDPDINQIFAGLSSMEDVTMSRGLIISDGNNEFYKWASAVHNPTAGHVGRNQILTRPGQAAANRYKKDVTVKMLDREGNVARMWRLYNAFPVSFVPGSDLDAGEDGDKSIEQLTLSYEDFKELDPQSGTPKDPSSSL